LVPLAKDYEIWLDPRRKQVVVGGEICLREGVLEMFACLRGTKEHESIVAVNSKAYLVHAALLALGVTPGKAAKFDPEYAPASGREVDVYVLWTDDQGQAHKIRAQQWVTHLDTKRTLEHPWVFVGSGFWTNEETGERYYYAEAGELICVSNFSTAMMDLPVPSSQSEDDLLFAANTELIPPHGTKVQLILIPK